MVKTQEELQKIYDAYNNALSNPIDIANLSDEEQALKIAIHITSSKSDAITMIQFDEQANILDNICFLLEIVLNGFNLLDPSSDIFKISNDIDPAIYVLNSYFKKAGFQIDLNEVVFFNKSEIEIFRQSNTYFMEIVKNNNNKGFIVGGNKYKLCENYNFKVNKNTKMEDIQCFFTTNNKIFTISFKLNYNK